MNHSDENTRQRLIRRWRWLLEGDVDSPEQRMHVGFLFFAACSSLAGATVNYVGGVADGFLVGVLTAVGLSLLVFWALVRNGLVAGQTMMMLLAWLVVGVILPLNWVHNQGMNGPSLLFFLTVAGYAFCVLLVKPWQRLVLFMLFLVVPYLLIVLQYSRPDWIAPYPSRATQAIDWAATYTICLGLMWAMVRTFFARFQREQRVIEDYAERLREVGRRDSLTGLLNHGAFYALVDTHCTPAMGDPAADAGAGALLIYDLDHFKAINDTYGHVYGDRTLQSFSRLLLDVLRPLGGAAGRCGGEEFAVFLPGGTQDDAEAFDSMLRAAGDRAPLEHGRIRFSGGLALGPAESVESWMECADHALYAAKCRGRDQTVFRMRGESAAAEDPARTARANARH